MLPMHANTRNLPLADRSGSKFITPVVTIYGSVSNGTQWRFLKLSGSMGSIDLMDYALPPVDQILGFLVWIARES
jgi:hypothetical protein